MQKVQSEVIDSLRLPLIIGVIFAHNYASTVTIPGMEFGNSGYLPVYHICSELFSQVLGKVPVRLFFFISGFLFFLNADFDKQCYTRKLKNRLKTLLIPYLFWNISTLIFYFIISNIPLFNAFLNGDFEFSLRYILESLWGKYDETTGMTYPISGPFWFIRDLMVVVILTPLIFLYVKKTKLYGVILLGILWFFGWWFGFAGTHGLSITALFFFTLGAWFSINGRRVVYDTDKNKIKYFFFILYPLLAIADLLTKGYAGNEFVHNAGILAGIPFGFGIAQSLIETKRVKVNKFLGASSFFVFAIHEPWLLRQFRKLLFAWLKPTTDMELTCLYFVIVLLVVLTALALYYLLKRFVPAFANMITGGR
jgi:fucose 4-O-acetylase-like acetyltransferase